MCLILTEYKDVYKYLENAFANIKSISLYDIKICTRSDRIMHLMLK
jgi:hypothetical protein